MTKNIIVVIADYTHETPLSFAEVCEICHVPPAFVQELIQFGVVKPAGESAENWLFNMSHLQRVQTAIRLRRDLEVNLAGVAVILDLLDEMEQLREQNRFFEKHFLV